MKSIIYLGVGLLSGAMAQNNLAGCGSGCIQSMQGLASDLGCTAGDTACLCRNPNFTYGIRDCSFQSCQQSGDAQQAVAAGVELCRQAGVAVEVTPVVTVSQPTGTATVTPSVSGGSSVATPSPVTTSSFTTVITSGGSTITSVGETTIFGVGGVPGASSVPASAVTTAPIVSTITSGGSVITSTIGSTTILSSLTGSDASSALSSQASDASEASTATATATETQSESATETQSESATQTQTGAATSASESGNAAKQTAVPVAGFLAAAGFAVMLI
ncbi:GPI-anchored CFEM domain protein ARB_01545 [Colletotrichum liriopes]|uniref:GPI-anchored CFEM domain protein ARB_01545 n=1 Tax=Colletotrichum liriopes TaxID=708192 RepID=A0AA37LSM1_9PEZI|nr:GPI-anchored CFEM domain protein ARB_01545 [Colletotrichum liriopes]